MTFPLPRPLPRPRAALAALSLTAASAALLLAPVAMAQAEAPPAAASPPVIAPGPAPIPAPAPAPVPVPGKPALWKVADADTTIYLFGTIHILPQPVDWNRGPVATALGSAGLLVTEAIIDSPEALQKEFVGKALRTDGKTLRDTMTPENRAKYEAALKSLSLPEGAFDPLDAWFAALALSTLPLQKAGYSQANGVEEQIAAYAKARQLKRDALETGAFQLGLFDTLPEDAQLAYLAEVVDELPKLDAEIAGLVAAWKEGRPDDLARILNEDESDPRVRQVLLVDRNATWAKWIKARLAVPGTVFIAVGAGHLAGKDSVQEDLAAEGIASVRVQ